jgi:large subunit ribosomal protein L22
VAAVEKQAPTEVRAQAKYVRTAPRKAQLVADQIRGRTVPEARTILTFMTRDAAQDVSRVLESAVANAEANHGLSGDELYVSAAYVGAGPTLKRWRARARGRVARIRKRTCHITVRLAMPDHAEIPLTPVAPPPEPIAEPGPEAEEDPAETEAEEEPKPKRASRKKPDEKTEEKAAEKAAEKPKRTRAKKADAAEKPKAEGKPKRTARKEKTDESEES